MAQRGLPYEYEIEEGKSGLTALGGLPTYLDLASASGLLKAIDRHMKVRTGRTGLDGPTGGHVSGVTEPCRG